jgi:hypothetical protein
MDLLAYPDATLVVMDMLDGLAPVRVAVPPDFDGGPLIVVKRIGGAPDAADETDHPMVQVSCYAPNYPAASELAAAVQVRILSSPLTEINGVLVDEARVLIGEQEVPDVYPDDRRIVSTYQLGWRRQYRP